MKTTIFNTTNTQPLIGGQISNPNLEGFESAISSMVKEIQEQRIEQEAAKSAIWELLKTWAAKGCSLPEVMPDNAVVWMNPELMEVFKKALAEPPVYLRVSPLVPVGEVFISPPFPLRFNFKL